MRFFFYHTFSFFHIFLLPLFLSAVLCFVVVVVVLFSFWFCFLLVFLEYIWIFMYILLFNFAYIYIFGHFCLVGFLPYSPVGTLVLFSVLCFR